MNERCRMSVIVPVYNCEKYLSRCLESLLRQTLQDMEIIVVNDGSTDNSPAICRKYAGQFDNITLIDQENRGAAAARIEGIRAARGEFIGFVDGDDWVDARMYETLYSEAQRLDADIIQCGYIKTDQEECAIPGQFDPTRTSCCSGREALFQLFGVRSEARFNYLLWNKIYRAEIFRTLELPTYHKANNDVPVIPRTFYEAKRIAVTEQQFIFYFSRNDKLNRSISDIQNSSLSRKIHSHILAFGDVSDYFRERDRELYLASLKHTISWALSALIRRNISPECRNLAKETIRKARLRGNPFIPWKKKFTAMLIQKYCH